MAAPQTSFHPHFLSTMPPSYGEKVQPQKRVLSPSEVLRLVTILVQTPSLLSAFLRFLPWSDFSALTKTCRPCRNLFQHPLLVQVILTRYVEGYEYCSRTSDARLRLQKFPITYRDLDMFMMSQSTPLTTYPTHALTVLSSRHPHFHHDAKSMQLKQLAQAHSHFILLLQSLAHSSSESQYPEPEHEIPTTSSSPSELEYSPTGKPEQRHHDVMQLSFPAPLSYAGENRVPSSSQSAVQPWPSSTGRRNRLRHTPSEANGTDIDSRPTSPTPSTARSVMSFRSSGRSTKLTAHVVKKRMSIFSSEIAVPVPPPAEPRALKHYSASWRQSLANASSKVNIRTKGAPSRNPSIFENESPTFVEEYGLPQASFIGQSSDNSSSGSLPSSVTRHSTAPNSPYGSLVNHHPPSSFHGPASRSRSVPPSPSTVGRVYTTSTSSPHDIRLATSRVRAPVLRVFVPCGRLSPKEGGSIQQCEEQLVQSGLWDQLSIGDVVCNLGYVPSKQDVNESPKWLIFNGEALVIFSLPEMVVPVEDPLLLPSPWYYEHLTPPSLPQTQGSGHRKHPSDGVRSPAPAALLNPRMILKQLPLPHASDMESASMRLVKQISTVKSPHSVGGFASVHQWVWLARMTVGDPYNVEGAALASNIGIGWEGKWVLEGDGTKEGRQILEDCIAGVDAGNREWEFVRERSGGGKIWLRLVPAPSPPHGIQRPASLREH